MLKKYQQDTLNALEKFLKLSASSMDIEGSYALCTKENLGHVGEYKNPIRKDLFESQKQSIPYVCLRLPTGGGKTLLAAHSLSIICNTYLAKDFNLVLWLVPSNAILEQTYLVLQNKKHFYRQALDESFNGKVEIMKISDAKSISQSSLQGQLCIIVSTYASWRVSNTDGRKVYENNGSLMSHFSNISNKTKEMLIQNQQKGDQNFLNHSLSNVVYLQNPIIIIDEAHNARTPLTFDVLEKLNPSCIIELTATPKTQGNDSSNERSNVLYNVSALELKAEDMIKMPILLQTNKDFQETINDAIAKQKELELIANEEEKTTGEYIRPIVLIQANDDSKDKTIQSTDEIKDHLIRILKINEDEIAIATGSERGIEGIDLNSKDCNIRYIITKQALKEGWDCPFAYIFCSIKDVKSSKDVEQLLGRILRMPNVKRKTNEELNKSYAFVKSKSFSEVANNLTDSLVDSGFTSLEAASLIEIAKTKSVSEYFGMKVISISELPKSQGIPREVFDKIELNYESKTLIIKDKLKPKEEQILINCFSNEEDRNEIESVIYSINKQNIYPNINKDKSIIIPTLSIMFEDELRIFDEEVLLPLDWDLSKQNVQIDFNSKYDSSIGSIDLNTRGKLRISEDSEIQKEITGLSLSSEMDKITLITWLDRECRDFSVPHAQNVSYIGKVIDNLINSMDFKIEHLVYKRFNLREILKEKIKTLVNEAKKKGFYDLFPKNINDLESLGKFSSKENFILKPYTNIYNRYTGRYEFKKHLGDIIGNIDNSEENECASIIDKNKNVDVWVKNIPKDESNSFWLQTSTDKFYPDFVVKLNNGNIVVVEYKGADRDTNDDSREKNLIGSVWAKISNCIFVMVNKANWSDLENALNN